MTQCRLCQLCLICWEMFILIPSNLWVTPQSFISIHTGIINAVRPRGLDTGSLSLSRLPESSSLGRVGVFAHTDTQAHGQPSSSSSEPNPKERWLLGSSFP